MMRCSPRPRTYGFRVGRRSGCLSWCGNLPGHVHPVSNRSASGLLFPDGPLPSSLSWAQFSGGSTTVPKPPPASPAAPSVVISLSTSCVMRELRSDSLIWSRLRYNDSRISCLNCFPLQRGSFYLYYRKSHLMVAHSLFGLLFVTIWASWVLWCFF